MFEELKNRGEEVVVFDGSKSSKDTSRKAWLMETLLTWWHRDIRPWPGRRTSQVAWWCLVLIDPTGKVIAAQPAEGDTMLHAPALKAAKESRFKPTLSNNKPVNVLGKIVYNFVAL